MYGCEIVWPSPIGSGRLSYAKMSCKAGTKRCRGTFPMAAITASPNLGRPVSAPVSRAIAAISATIRARAAARGSCACEGWACVSASRKSAGSRTASMSRPGSGDHQAGQALRIGKQFGARTAVGDAAAVQHERALRDSERDFRVLFDQHDRKRVLVDQSLQGLQQDLDDDGCEPLERLVHEQQRRLALVLDASGVKGRVAHDGRKQRGLADPVPAEDREGAALRQLERDVLEDYCFAVTSAHVAETERARHGAVRRDRPGAPAGPWRSPPAAPRPGLRLARAR